MNSGKYGRRSSQVGTSPALFPSFPAQSCLHTSICRRFCWHAGNRAERPKTCANTGNAIRTTITPHRARIRILLGDISDYAERPAVYPTGQVTQASERIEDAHGLAGYTVVGLNRGAERLTYGKVRVRARSRAAPGPWRVAAEQSGKGLEGLCRSLRRAQRGRVAGIGRTARAGR